jgi:succinoglycan biosynthesis protein ExoA
MSALPFVTLVMPSYHEEPYIEECLRSLLRQTYPADRMEILVADGGSQDKTREIVNRLAAEDPRVRLLDNSQHRIQSYGMNLAIKESRGEFILVTDVHAEYAGDYVAKIVEVFLRTGADVAGEKEGWVDTVFPGSFRRSMLEKVGLYDVKAVTNEDAELMQRILEAGGRVYLSREVVVHYYPRKSFRLLAKQYFKYGDGRARTLLMHKRFPVVRPLIPFLFVVGGATILVVPPLQVFAPAAFGTYAALTGLEALRVGLKEGLWAVPVVWAIFPTMHLAHGIGMLQGLVKYTLNPKPPLIEQLDPRSDESGPPRETVYA